MKRWKKLLCLVLFCAFLLTLVAPAMARTVPDSTTVYVTDTGSKYHRAGCSYLKSKHAMTVLEAERKGYGPCSRCDPDVLTGELVSHPGSSGSGASSGSKKTETSKVSEPGAEKSDKKETSWVDRVAGVVLVAIFLWPLAVFPVLAIVGIVDYLRKKMKYTRLYRGRSVEELVGMPRGTEIGDDGLPKMRGAKEWGAQYTCYVSPKGQAYHREHGCSGATQKIHVCQAMKKKRPCSKCQPQTAEDLRWYAEYIRVKGIKTRYGIK